MRSFVVKLLLCNFLLLSSVVGYASPLPASEKIAKDLGWVPDPRLRCGGYYLDQAIRYPDRLLLSNAIEITSDQMLFAQKGTSSGKGKVTITRYGQQIMASKISIYRDPTTFEMRSIDLESDVVLRQPNSLVLAKRGRYDLKTKSESLHDVLYRTAIYSNPHYRPTLPSNDALQQDRKIYQLSGWGEATSFSKTKPKVYEFEQASYSTCPPTAGVWQVKTETLTLNKETGRGSATHARLYLKDIPVFYTPYFNFPIDSRRETGLLWPSFGSNSRFGPFFTMPFYWNMAPNYDMTLTPAYLSKRGVQFADLFRYLTPHSAGSTNIEVLPYDREFANFKAIAPDEFSTNLPAGFNADMTQAYLNRIKNASVTRGSFNWLDKTRYNEHWSSDVTFNWVSDDYYLRDFITNIDQTTQNQLLQQAEINYKNTHWDFIGRLQNYQTLHPIDSGGIFYNQYIRVPQLILNGDYPDGVGGLNYFISNETTHFDLRHNPGIDTKYPVGNRLNTQPGLSRPFMWPYLQIIPRLQFALTQYDLSNIDNTAPRNPSRALPIFDLNSSLYFDRDILFFKQRYKQTLEPRIYYTYIPYRNQNNLPLFDTTVNTLTYDQLFTYNRFSGIDRINDANQVALGFTSRMIDQQAGVQKVEFGVGQIVYFRERKVTLCSAENADTCPPGTVDYPNNPDNKFNRSPLAALFNYNVNPNWQASANSIWNPKTNQLDNQNIGVYYQPPGTNKALNFGYNFVRGGDAFLDASQNSYSSNLSSTDISYNWPIFRDLSSVGRWTQNWNHHHFQNLLFGLQYDSCCWAIRFVAGRVFAGLNPNNTFQYNTQFFITFALKGLGNVGNGDPGQVLGARLSGYQTNFGRDF